MSNTKNDQMVRLSVGKIRYLMHMAFKQGEIRAGALAHDDAERKSFIDEAVHVHIFDGAPKETREQYNERRHSYQTSLEE